MSMLRDEHGPQPTYFDPKNVTWQTRGPNQPFSCLDRHNNDNLFMVVFLSFDLSVTYLWLYKVTVRRGNDATPQTRTQQQMQHKILGSQA